MKVAGHDLGDYWKDEHGYFAVTPNGLLCGLNKHSVIEHEDGTMTFSPSILATNGRGGRYHGYLEKGKWRTLPDSTKGVVE